MRDLNKAIELDPATPASYITRGAIHVQLNQPQKALADYNKAIALSPATVAEAYFNRGNYYLRGDQYDKAIADYTRAIEIKPGHAGAYCARASAWAMKDDYGRAWADVKKSRQLGLEPQASFIQALRKVSGRQE